MNTMATSTTTITPISEAVPMVTVARGSSLRRRRIDPRAGHALEILGHAIEYLTDEFVHSGGDLSPHNPELQAVQLLMAVNRAIYFDCPEVPSLRERCRRMMGGRNA
jgi:hypothetical protein